MTMWDQLVKRWHPADPFRPDEPGVRRYYETKAAIVTRLKPRSICEIGVRAGYSAFAFLFAAPRGTQYFGIDWGVGGARPGDDEDARNEASMLSAHVKDVLQDYAARVLWVDSQKMMSPPYNAQGHPFELFHVDGDHSYAGCLHDLTLAEPSRYILVDDFDVGPEVRAACRTFLLTHAGWRAEYVPDGFRGNLLLTKGPL